LSALTPVDWMRGRAISSLQSVKVLPHFPEVSVCGLAQPAAT